MTDEAARSRSPQGRGSYSGEIIDTHIHLSTHYSGGLKNLWHPSEAASFQRDFTEADYRNAIKESGLNVKHAVYVECFNTPAAEEAKWVLGMIDDPKSIVCALTAHIECQKGATAVNEFLDSLRREDGSLPTGLKGARAVFMAMDNNTPEACLDETFHEGLSALEKAGLHWEFCCNPSMAPNLATCCKKFPGMTFIIDHLAHNGNDGGAIDKWGPAIDDLGKLPNVFMKMGAIEEWEVENPDEYLDRAIAAFGFDRILFESNWFVSAAMGDSYARTPSLLYKACQRAKATSSDLQKVFAGNARKVYRLDV